MTDSPLGGKTGVPGSVSGGALARPMPEGRSFNGPSCHENFIIIIMLIIII